MIALKTHNYRPLEPGKTQFKKFKRMQGKSLRQHLLHRFLHQYGYDKGEVTAKAIVNDILNLIERYFIPARPDNDCLPLKYGQMAWLAIPINEQPERGKSMAHTKTQPVVLTFLCDEDVASRKEAFSSRAFRIRRMVRWTEEAFDQGALLTQLDLALLLNVSDSVVSQYVNEYQQLTGKILPTRGNIQDLSGAITHKREIIALYQQGYLTPAIAKRTNHTKESVDRYIRDYETVKMLASVIPEVDKIVQMARLSKKVVQQYLDLIPAEEITPSAKPEQQRG